MSDEPLTKIDEIMDNIAKIIITSSLEQNVPVEWFFHHLKGHVSLRIDKLSESSEWLKDNPKCYFCDQKALTRLRFGMGKGDVWLCPTHRNIINNMFDENYSIDKIFEKIQEMRVKK